MFKAGEVRMSSWSLFQAVASAPEYLKAHSPNLAQSSVQ